MGIYLQASTGGEPSGFDCSSKRFAAEIVLDRMAAVADYALVVLDEQGRRGTSVAQLPGYARWSEPGLALAARLLWTAPPGLLDVPLGGCPLTIELDGGPTLRGAVPLESMRLTESNGEFFVTVMSNVGQVVKSCPPVPATSSLRAAMEQSLFWAFGWHRCPPAVPSPLNEVPLLDGQEGPVVALADIPPHARAHFVRQFELADWPPTVQADLWLAFIGEAPFRFSSSRPTK